MVKLEARRNAALNCPSIQAQNDAGTTLKCPECHPTIGAMWGTRGRVDWKSTSKSTSKAVKAGVVWINTYNMFNAASPFGGYKQSGYGREMGRHALELYTQVKSVWVDLSGKPIGWFGK